MTEQTKDWRFGQTTINQELSEKFPDLPQDHHESDLYIKYTPEVWEYLREHYIFFTNCTTFFTQVEGERWIEIPFAYDQFWKKKVYTKQQQ